MRLLHEHPRIPSCADCQRYIVDYNFSDGTGSGQVVMLGPANDQSRQRPHERPAHTPPPCRLGPGRCPKGSPESEHEHVLSDRNRQTLLFYQRSKAVAHRGLTEAEARDGVLVQNFAALDKLFAELERDDLCGSIGTAVSLSISRLFGR